MTKKWKLVSNNNIACDLLMMCCFKWFKRYNLIDQKVIIHVPSPIEEFGEIYKNHFLYDINLKN